ncbi:MAG: methytransferase partner Trm112 [Dehalococcoidia bacterium]|nr:methytransferase partner Trm112 [Dehalococcoidia bacterium]
MRTDLLDIIACPVCKGPLTLEAETIAPDDAPDAGEVLTGTLACAFCDERYPIADGIPNLLPPDLRDAEAAAGR